MTASAERTDIYTVHIQGEGMGITVFVANGVMTGDTPALDVHGPAVGKKRVGH